MAVGGLGLQAAATAKKITCARFGLAGAMSARAHDDALAANAITATRAAGFRRPTHRG
jgi:hypothetical protein